MRKKTTHYRIYIKARQEAWEEVMQIFQTAHFDTCTEFIAPTSNKEGIGFITMEYNKNNKFYDIARTKSGELVSKYWDLDTRTIEEKIKDCYNRKVSTAYAGVNFKEDPWFVLGWRPTIVQ